MSTMSFGDRFTLLLNQLWDGNRSRMARDLKCAQSLVSMIATGKRPPGRDVLAKLGHHPLVNAAWLLTGEGEPLIDELKKKGGCG
jgi:hypothetical protein